MGKHETLIGVWASLIISTIWFGTAQVTNDVPELVVAVAWLIIAAVWLLKHLRENP